MIMDFFKNISNDVLDVVDMNLFQIIDNEEYQNYYTDRSSKEHYRLLTHISNSFNDETLVLFELLFIKFNGILKLNLLVCEFK